MTNAILSVLDEVEAMPEVSKHIVQHDLSGQYNENVWADMVNDAVSSGCATREGWETFLEPYEILVLEARERAGEAGLKTKGSKKAPARWKLTKVSHNSSYRSNKSVIGNALDVGVELMVDGRARPKSQVEKELRGEVEKPEGAARVRRTAFERCQEAITTITTLYPQCSETEQEYIDKVLKECTHG